MAMMTETKKFKMKKAVYLIMAGFLILAIDILVSTGIDYGFQVGNGEGVKKYAMTSLVMAYVGMKLRIDIILDPIGYILVAVGMTMLGKSYQTKKASLLALIGSVSYVTQMLLPFALTVSKLVIPVIALFLVQVVCITAMMYSFVAKTTTNIDNYTYMNVKKDLKFAAELYAISAITANILLLFSKVGWYFAGTLYILVSLIAIADMIYFVVKSMRYIYQLRLYEEASAKQNDR